MLFKDTERILFRKALTHTGVFSHSLSHKHKVNDTMNWQANRNFWSGTSSLKYIARLKLKDSSFLCIFQAVREEHRRNVLNIPSSLCHAPCLAQQALWKSWVIYSSWTSTYTPEQREAQENSRGRFVSFQSFFLVQSLCSSKKHWLINKPFKIIGKSSEVKSSTFLVSLMHRVLSTAASLHPGHSHWINFWDGSYWNNNNVVQRAPQRKNNSSLKLSVWNIALCFVEQWHRLLISKTFLHQWDVVLSSSDRHSQFVYPCS